MIDVGEVKLVSICRHLSVRVEVGGWRLEVGGWRLEVGICAKS